MVPVIFMGPEGTHGCGGCDKYWQRAQRKPIEFCGACDNYGTREVCGGCDKYGVLEESVPRASDQLPNRKIRRTLLVTLITYINIL